MPRPRSILFLAVVVIVPIGLSGLAYGQSADYVGAAPQSPITLTVHSQDSFGRSLEGFFVVVTFSNGTQTSGFTPLVVTVANNETYTVQAQNYGMYRFHNWIDPSASPSQKQITAVYYLIPTHPTNLNATAVSPAQINLTWKAPSFDGSMPVTGYKIQRSLDDHMWTNIVKDTGSTSTAYSDTGLTSDKVYYYRVFALSSVGQSYRSNIADAITPLPSTTINGTAIGNITITQPTFGR